MIFVTVGNGTRGFHRLLEVVDSLAGKGMLGDEKVFLQTGNTLDFRPSHCEYKPFLSMDEFQEYMEKADLIITHGGCGTLLTAVRLGKFPVAMPRRKKYGEIVNDHQIQIVQALAAEGRVIPAYEPEDLPGAIVRALEENARRKAREVRSEERKSPMLELVERTIEELQKNDNPGH